MDFLNEFLGFIPNILWAIIFLVIAFVCATLVKATVGKLLKLTKLEKTFAGMGMDVTAMKGVTAFIEKLAYFVTFLLFLPSVLDRLDMTGVSSPIIGMTNAFLSYIPGIVTGGIVATAGMCIAKIVRQLLVPVLRALKVDVIQEKAGMRTNETASFSVILANLVYALILLVTITAAIDMVGISAISAPANAVVHEIFGIIPNVMATVIIIGIGIYVAKIVESLVKTLLAGTGIDSLAKKAMPEGKCGISLSGMIALIIRHVIHILFFVQAMHAMGLGVLSSAGNMIITYLPNVLIAAIIICAGICTAHLAGNAIKNLYPDASISVIIAKTAIYVLTGFLSLSHLGVASAIVNTAFLIILASAGVAFAIAFGIGGKQFAAHMLEKLEKKMEKKAENKLEK